MSDCTASRLQIRHVGYGFLRLSAKPAIAIIPVISGRADEGSGTGAYTVTLISVPCVKTWLGSVSVAIGSVMKTAVPAVWVRSTQNVVGPVQSAEAGT